MANEQTTPIDKSKWSYGPWSDEPDRVEWRDEATGLPCLIVRHPSSGHLCGYVAVPPGHAFHGKDYGARIDGSTKVDDDGNYKRDNVPSIDGLMRVHGGITYASGCAGNICHKPAEGEPDNVWWFGFDCAHCNDISPRWDSDDRRSWDYAKKYRTVDYVRAECADLARQLAKVTP